MIVHDLYVAGSVVRPTEADAPLRVDPNAALAFPFTPQGLQPVARQGGEILKCFRAVQQGQATCSLIGESLECCDPIALEETPRVSALEALDQARGLYPALRYP